MGKKKKIWFKIEPKAHWIQDFHRDKRFFPMILIIGLFIIYLLVSLINYAEKSGTASPQVGGLYEDSTNQVGQNGNREMKSYDKYFQSIRRSIKELGLNPEKTAKELARVLKTDQKARHKLVRIIKK